MNAIAMPKKMNKTTHQSFMTFITYVCTSLIVAAIDYFIFWVSKYGIENTTIRVLIARFVSILTQYILINFHVFKNTMPKKKTFPYYALLVVINAVIVSKMILAIQNMGMAEIPSKIISEMILYLPNYWITKTLIFKSSCEKKGDEYKSSSF